MARAAAETLRSKRGLELAGNMFGIRARHVAYIDSLREKSNIITIKPGEIKPIGKIETLQIDRETALQGLTERAHAMGNVLETDVSVSTGKDLAQLETSPFYHSLKETFRWGESNTGIINIIQGEPTPENPIIELEPLAKRAENEEAGRWHTPEILREGVLRTVQAVAQNAIPNSGQRINIAGPAAAFRGINPDNTRAAAEAGVNLLVKRDKEGGLDIKNGTSHIQGRLDSKTTIVSYPALEGIADADPYAHTILVNTGAVQENPGRKISQTEFPAVISFTLPPGKELTDEMIAKLVSGAGTENQLAGASISIFSRSQDGSFHMKGNTIATLPDYLPGETAPEIVKAFGEKDSLIGEVHEVPEKEVVEFAGIVDARLNYASATKGHFHQERGNPSAGFSAPGHLTTIMASENPVEIAIVVRPAEWRLVNTISDLYTQTGPKNDAKTDYIAHAQARSHELGLPFDELGKIYDATNQNAADMARIVDAIGTPQLIPVTFEILDKVITISETRMQKVLESLDPKDEQTTKILSEAKALSSYFGSYRSNLSLASAELKRMSNLENIEDPTDKPILKQWEDLKASLTTCVDGIRSTAHGETGKSQDADIARTMGRFLPDFQIAGFDYLNNLLSSAAEGTIVNAYFKAAKRTIPVATDPVHDIPAEVTAIDNNQTATMHSGKENATLLQELQSLWDEATYNFLHKSRIGTSIMWVVNGFKKLGKQLSFLTKRG